jgi:hypothetical protein
MPPDKAAAIKMLLYLLTAGWCKVGYSTPMNVNISKTPPFTNPPNVVRKHFDEIIEFKQKPKLLYLETLFTFV